MNSKFLKSVAIMVGTTIGAGIFALPYAIMKAGFVNGMIYLLVLGLLNVLVNLLYGEMVLRTAGDHQMTGYGQIYLGKIGKALASITLFVTIYGALLAYIIKTGEFASLILNLSQPFLFSLVFFALASSAIFFGLKTLAKFELLLTSLILIFIYILALIAFPYLQSINYQPAYRQAGQLFINNLLLPYGVILFALTGMSAVPEMEELLRSEPQSLKKAILIGSLIPLIVYLVFVAVIVGVSGRQTSPDAIFGLLGYLPAWVVRLGAGLGILTMSTSFLSLGFVLREAWFRDFKFNKNLAFPLAVFPSLVLFLLGARNFIGVLEIAGSIACGLSGLLVVWLYYEAKKHGQRAPAYSLGIPKILLLILAIVFILGIFSPLF
jgi:amino acid permease